MVLVQTNAQPETSRLQQNALCLAMYHKNGTALWLQPPGCALEAADNFGRAEFEHAVTYALRATCRVVDLPCQVVCSSNWNGAIDNRYQPLYVFPPEVRYGSF